MIYALTRCWRRVTIRWRKTSYARSCTIYHGKEQEENHLCGRRLAGSDIQYPADKTTPMTIKPPNPSGGRVRHLRLRLTRRSHSRSPERYNDGLRSRCRRWQKYQRQFIWAPSAALAVRSLAQCAFRTPSKHEQQENTPGMKTRVSALVAQIARNPLNWHWGTSAIYRRNADIKDNIHR